MSDATKTLGVDQTHDASTSSWYGPANERETDFPIQNLPLGRFAKAGSDARCGAAIGDAIVDLTALAEAGLLSEVPGIDEAAASGDNLPILERGHAASSALRSRLFELLREGGDDALRQMPSALILQADVTPLLPTNVRSFSDMCVSTFHIGRLRGSDERGEPVCPPMFRTLPVGYDGRASSVVITGTEVRRPLGQWSQAPDQSGPLRFGPEPRQDYELEVGGWVSGPSNPLGNPISLAEANERLFGLTLLNDWSARGIQLWETMLGPFLGKSIATTVSPWIVTAQALAPFRTRAFRRPEGDPAVPLHLSSPSDQERGGFDIELTADLDSAAMRAQDLGSVEICRTNFRHMYWTWAQMLAHHASNGCSLGAGDLLGSGTCSGPAFDEAACLAEKASRGPFDLPDATCRFFLEDGDRITLRGRANRDGYRTIGFGTAVGTISPAPVWPQ